VSRRDRLPRSKPSRSGSPIATSSSADCRSPARGHSRLFDPILEEFRAFLSKLKLDRPKIPFISNRTGQPIRDEEATSPEYWVSHLRYTVRFAEGIETILSTPGRLLIEVGPGQSLCSFARQSPAARQGANIVPSLRHREDKTPDSAYFTAALGRVWASGLEIDLSRLRAGEKRRRVPLPTYAWNHQSYFIEPTPVAAISGDDTTLERIENVEDWGRRPVWLSAAFERSAGRTDETWLLFMDEAGIGRRLRERLVARGEKVVSVFEGDAFHKRAAEPGREGDEYTLAPELGRAGYDALIKDLVAHGRTPTQIVHLWLTTDAERFRPGSSFLHQNIQDGFYSLYFLAQALGEESLPRPVQITVVSNGMQTVGAEDPVRHPEKATVLGPVKVIPREFPDLLCKSVDVELPVRREGLAAVAESILKRKSAHPRGAQLERVAENLLKELDGRTTNEVVVHRGDRRFVRRFEEERLAPSPSPAASGLRPGGTYLLTGGLGGLALNLADRLTRDLRPRLVLLGRSGLPPRAEWDAWLASRGGSDPTGRRILRIRALESAGAQVEVVSADVTNHEQMRALADDLRTRLGKIDGVFHIAGVVKDELIQLKLDAEIEEVFGPKVYGTLVLDGLLEALGCELFVLFSSTSAIAAPAGQVDYAAANAFLDAYAWSRAGSKVRTVSVNWGIWNEVGMAAESFGDRPAPSAKEASLPTGPMQHPFFDARIRDEHGRSAFSKSYSPLADWVLDEHRTKSGQALLPGTAYPELARAALAEYGETAPFEIRDLYFIRPVFVPDGERRDVRVRLLASDRGGYRFEVRTGCRVEGRAGFELNVQASLELGHLATPAPVDLAAIDARCQRTRGAVNPNGHRSGQEEHVAFGPRWRVLRQVLQGEGEALALLELPEAYRSDLERIGLHPGLLDYATGYAMELIEGYTPALGLWIPVSYGRMAVFGPLPARVYSWVRNRGENRASSDFAVFDVTICDEQGRVLLEIEEYTIKRLAVAPDFTLHAPPVRADVEFEAALGSRSDRELSPAERQLRRNYERGIRAHEGADALMRVLALDGASQIAVSSLDLAGLIRQAERATAQVTKASSTKFGRPDLDSEYKEPSDDVERTLVGIWEELLGVAGLGVRDNFFDLGGHSLIAVRLFTMIKKTYKADFPISVLFEAPTIEGCAELIREAMGETGAAPAAAGVAAADSGAARGERRTRHKYLVAMDPNRGQGGQAPPFFLVAGMFGNVLNLRHLATLVGADRPFYGLQARGLYGDEPPHETFEEMATAYIEEIRSVQPHGPYSIGGFSGGGLTAFEIAHQLRAAGEEISLLLLLDSRLPQTPRLSKVDRAKIQWQRVRQRGPGYLLDWARNRAKWQMEQIQLRLGQGEPARAEDQFHNEAIEQAFRRALPRYQMRHYPGPMVLFRPKLDRAYVLGPGRVLDSAKEWVWEDNGFGAYVDAIEVHEMPGDHDSMVLEPNVRVMAARLRACLAEAQARTAAGAAAESKD
jgi:acyl transferase domain-containing protein/thioesterase domain-containing protein